MTQDVRTAAALVYRREACLRDHDGQQLAYVYFEDEPSASLSNKTGEGNAPRGSHH
jgi:hypothetical protein